jgi:hypothetical protein
MEVEQWIARRPGCDDLMIVFAAASTERLPAAFGLPALRRRSAPLVSDELPRPLVAAVAVDVVDDDRPPRLAAAAAAAGLRVVVTHDGDSPFVVGDDVRFAAVLGEFVGVVAGLCEAAQLPFVAASGGAQGGAIDVGFGPLQGLGRARLADALVTLAVGVRTAALARGFDARCEFVLDSATRIIDGRIEEWL